MQSPPRSPTKQQMIPVADQRKCPPAPLRPVRYRDINGNIHDPAQRRLFMDQTEAPVATATDTATATVATQTVLE